MTSIRQASRQAKVNKNFLRELPHYQEKMRDRDGKWGRWPRYVITFLKLSLENGSRFPGTSATNWTWRHKNRYESYRSVPQERANMALCTGGCWIFSVAIQKFTIIIQLIPYRKVKRENVSFVMISRRVKKWLQNMTSLLRFAPVRKQREEVLKSWLKLWKTRLLRNTRRPKSCPVNVFFRNFKRPAK